MAQNIKTSPKTKARAIAERETMRNMLLSYALRLGATDEATQRLIAARLWRLLPRAIDPLEAILRLDRHLGIWASAVLGHPVTVSQLANAIIDNALVPNFVLLPAATLTARDREALAHALTPVTPDETPTAMPVQSLAPFYALRGATQPAATLHTHI